MTNQRSTNEEKEQRINYAADELAKGKRAMDISKKLASNLSCSRQLITFEKIKARSFGDID